MILFVIRLIELKIPPAVLTPQKGSYYFYDNGKKILRDIYITVKDTEPPVITEAPDELHLRGYHGDADELAALIARNVTALTVIRKSSHTM